MPWDHLPTFTRLGLALGIGLFVGLERERRGKEAGLRTFGFAALLGALGGLTGDAYALLALVLIGVLVVFLNWQTLRADEGTELTTSAALLVTGFSGVLAGQGHTFTPVAVGIASAALLSWKERLAGFTLGLTDVELRSAILLGILAFIVYPLLPEAPVDPWGLVQPRTAWVTVILIAALGFVNYVLLKLYGSRGVVLTGFLGGLVNTTVTVAELAGRVKASDGLLRDVAYRGIVLSVAAMLVRNTMVLGLLASSALPSVLLPVGLMLAMTGVVAVLAQIGQPHDGETAPTLHLASPFSLQSALKFGLLFLAMEVAGSIAQSVLGEAGLYAVSFVGGLVSSASAVASAGSLALHGQVTPAVAGAGAVIASLASLVVNLPLVWRVSADRALTMRLALVLGLVTAAGVIGLMVQPMLARGLS